MWRADSLEKTVMLGNAEGKRRRGQQRMRLLDNITNSMDMNLSKLWEIVEDSGVFCAVVHGVTKSQTWLSIWTAKQWLKRLSVFSCAYLPFATTRMNLETMCSVNKSCPTLYDPMDCNVPGFPVLHYFPEFAQIHVHWVGDAIQPSHPLSPPFYFCLQSFSTSGSFPLSSSHQVTKVLELQLQQQSIQWLVRVDFL